MIRSWYTLESTSGASSHINFRLLLTDTCGAAGLLTKVVMVSLTSNIRPASVLRCHLDFRVKIALNIRMYWVLTSFHPCSIGSSISVNLLTGIYSGSAQIIVDGDFVGNVDTYQSTYCSDGGFAKFAVFNRDNLTVGEHNITVVNGGPSHVGTRDIDIYSFM